MTKKSTKSNLVNEFSRLVKVLGFKKQQIDNHIYEKKYHDGNCCILVDFLEQNIKYPVDKDFIVNDKATCNFSAPENMVVLECVDRLLTKGYRPEHIELEKRWKLGHSSKSGKADIYVKDDDGNGLIIIECKTYGAEYNKELKNVAQDGGQLFSYWQQEKKIAWLCLYASIVQNSEIKYENEVIRCKDDENLIGLAKYDKSILLYDFAKNVSELHDAWKNTYSCKKEGNVIFGKDSIAYEIGVKPLRKKDLESFENATGIAQSFKEILRHNSVSDRENAFNRLVALFICKLVDEITKSDDDEVDFQYKIGYDTYESLQDRLQRLHQTGMKYFMDEEIFYVSENYPDNLFTNYTGQNRIAAINDLRDKIKKLKYYTNNDFSFKDVHNEELFRQNGKILVEVVQLFQQYRIVYSSKQQFLGNMFEGLLSSGFKQSEGQYFTPPAITRFMWDSLPLGKYINGKVYPKIIDYACGAGHILTEGVEAINEYTKSEGSNSWTRDSIYGVEKDYRLARVSKISMYMNGAGDSNIVYGDGLDNSLEKGICNEKFDILVSNPPYSVQSFKLHLSLKNNKLDILEKITSNGSEIQNCFIERANQLLKSKGAAAIVLPVSVLTTPSSSFEAARKIILQNFHIRSLVLLGSKTFGETGTNTVIMFLEKHDASVMLHSRLIGDYIDAVLDGRSLDDWDDKLEFDSYLKFINISECEYRSLLCGNLVGNNAYTQSYKLALDENKDIIKLKNSRRYLNLSEEDKEEMLRTNIAKKIKVVEEEKLRYYSLLGDNNTLIVRSPVANKKQKEFLGYKWSKRKTSEGHHDNKQGGLLCDANVRYASGTIAAAVRSMFVNNSVLPALPQTCLEYARVVSTKELLDFKSSTFNNVINVLSQPTLCSFNCPTMCMKDILAPQPSVDLIKSDDIKDTGCYPVVTQDQAKLKSGYVDVGQPIKNWPVIVFGDHNGSVKYIDFDFVCSGDGVKFIRPKKSTGLLIEFLYYYLKCHPIGTGEYQRHFKILKKMIVPIPPKTVQERIIKLAKECNGDSVRILEIIEDNLCD